jgi:outer membrane protein assembly factor BamB
MPRFLIALALVCLSLPARAAEPGRPDAERITFGPADWPWWRGPNRNGIAADQKLPLKWSEKENVVWKSPVPGRGHGSPIVAGDQVFLATADEEQEIQSVLCFDRRSGKQLWQTEVHRAGFEKKGNAKSSHASSTMACDGKRVFINFLNDGAIHTTALDRDGKILWQTRVTDYVLHQGFASSPTVYGPLVLVSADNKGTAGAIAGLDRATGKVVWKQERPHTPNYASPIILKVAGREQLLMTGCDLVAGLEPLTGKKLWEIKGSTTETVTSTVTDGKVIFVSGGFPKDHVAAIRADGSGEVVWEQKIRVYVPSMIVHKGHLYAVSDSGIALCWQCETGKEVWKGRVDGAFSASPVLVGDTLFAVSESGRMFLLKATPDSFQLLGQNQLGDEALATPTICGNRIYLRVAVREQDKRQEMLYCLGRDD